MDILKIIVVALVGLISATFLKSIRKDLSIYITIATTIIILLMVFDSFSYILDYFSAIYNRVEYGKEYFPIIIKVLVTAYLSDFTAQICKDAGENAIAAKVELAGKIIIFCIATPMLLSIIKLIDTIL